MFEVAKTVGESLLQAERKLTGHEDMLIGTVRVTMAPVMAEYIFAPHLREFAQKYPGIDVHFLTGSSVMDISRRDADIAIRTDNNPPETLFGKCLFPYFQTTYATKEYLSSHDFQSNPGGGRWINFHDGDARSNDWAKRTDFGLVPAWGYFPDLSVQRALAANSSGLAFLPCMVGDADERLIRATKTPPVKSRNIWILTRADLLHTSKIKEFMEFAEKVIRLNKAAITGNI